MCIYGDAAAAVYSAMLRAAGSAYPLDVVELAGLVFVPPAPIETPGGIYDEEPAAIAALLRVQMLGG
ncbi:hypothetical protein [Halorubrum lacusprofundi]|uniref:hypothetical protein n=1 Tax=Halorubrum lacusprofundi TaxID=2247 RepID=UPI000B5A73BD|nr:hypothetical protein [Halorubrum lacusprofundi]